MRNKIITIYELMGLIKDGQAPKKIEYNNEEFDYNFGDYYNTNDINLFNHYAIKAFSIKEIMNLKVEILPEENDEWEDIEEIETLEENIKYTKNSTTHIIGIDDKEKDVYIPILNKLIKNQRKIIEKLESKNEIN